VRYRSCEKRSHHRREKNNPEGEKASSPSGEYCGRGAGNYGSRGNVDPEECKKQQLGGGARRERGLPV